MQNFLEEKIDIKQIIKNKNLNHIAIIMDGNRRWAKLKQRPIADGHNYGVDVLVNILKAFKKFGIKYLTVYAFSTENWKRSKEEVDFLMSLLAKTVIEKIPLFKENNIKLTFIGSRKELSSKIIDILNFGEEQTKNNNGVNLQIAFNYGSRCEIVNALKSICADVKNNNLEISDITENTITKRLYTSNIPEPALLIRTGGEKRISNFLLWQCAYTEIYVTDVLWPDFNEEALIKAILEFDSRNRRFGK